MTTRAETDRLNRSDSSRAEEPNQLFDRALVNQAFTRLHPSHREVVYKAYYLRWTTCQIAADLNVTQLVVKRRLHDALRPFLYMLDDPHSVKRPIPRAI